MIKWRKPESTVFYPLTHPQKRIWYTEQIYRGTGLFNIGGILRIKGKIAPDIFEQAVRMMINRNDALRLCIINNDGEPEQYVRELEDFVLPLYDFSEEENPIEKANNLIKAKTSELFAEGEFIDCILIKIADDDYLYLQKCHHIISDGWTFSLIKKEIELCYRYLLNEENNLNDSPPSYLEFINDENEYRQSKNFGKHRDFWLSELETASWGVNLSPYVHSSKTVYGQRYTVHLDKETTSLIKDYVKETPSSLYSFLMAVLYAYIYRITGVEDIVIGTPVLNRSNARQKNTMGMFVSTMPFMAEMNGEMNFSDFLKYIVSRQRAYYRNQKYPMDLLVKDLKLAQKGNQKLYEISLSYQNSTYEQTFNGYPIELYWIFNGYEENSLTVHINDRMERDELVIDFDYAVDAFKEEGIKQLARHLINFARQVIKDDKKALREMTYMDEDEINRILYEWNKTEVYYPGNEKTISQLIEEQVEKTPDHIALVWKEKKLTYKELNNLANELAVNLRSMGIMPDDRVGLLTDRSLEAVISIVAILKAGGAYVPIDPTYPLERCRYMVEDAGCKILLTQSQLKEKALEIYSGEIIQIDEFLVDKKGNPANLKPTAGPDNLCYVIYTSGSTGQPKGVMVENRGLTNYIWWAKDYYCPDGQCNFPLYSSLSFDLTVTSIFTPLITGSTIYIMGNDRVNLISQVIKEKGINIVKLTPSHLALIKDEDNTDSRVTKMILGGEDLKAELARDAIESFNGNLEIYNEYGPTETVVGCIIHKFNPSEDFLSVLIGKPINNTQIYILDKNMQPLPAGAIGEIYISGDGVARGYLNKPDLTAERFLKNPFLNGKRMYRSGDLGRYHFDGSIEYLGRIDTQVKIRGYRIEMGEVEAALLQHPEVKDGVIDVRTDISGNKYLACYFVSDKELTVGDLRGHLLAILPEYMVPTVYMQLEEIPLTSNGKVDKNKLPDVIEKIKTGVEYKAPQTEMEEIMAQVWTEVLGLERVGVNDNFFELGGDSIKAIQVSTRLKNRGIECKVQDIFNYYTISRVALHASYNVKEIRAEQGIVEGAISRTPIVSWFFDQGLKNPNYYHQSILLDLNSGVQIPHLEKAFDYLIKHHDALRLNYDFSKEQLYYNNKHLNTDFTITFYDLTDLSPAEQKIKLTEYCEKIKENFAIDRDLLIKAAVFEMTDSRKFFITLHHLIIDGVSWRIILEDLANIYSQVARGKEVTPPKKTTSYKEWAEALLEYSQSLNIKRQIPYWEEVLKDLQPFPGIKDSLDNGLIVKTHFIKRVLDEETTSVILGKANEAYNTRVNDLLLTGLVKAFKSLFKQEKICIWLEGHGREEIFSDIDLSSTVGWFTAIYPVVFEIAEVDELGKLIKTVKERIRQTPSNGIGYGILKYLTSYPFTGDVNLQEVVFNYLGQFDEDLPVELFSYTKEDTGLEIAKENQRANRLEFNAMVINKKLEIEVNFDPDIISIEKGESLLELFVNNLQEIVSHCSDSNNFGFTPSDFDTVELSQEDLDFLFG